MPTDSFIARRAAGRIEVRDTPIRLHWDLADLTSSDGHAISLRFSCTIRPLPDATEVRMLEEAMMASRSSVGESDLTEHFAKTIAPAARRYVPGQTAAAILSDSGRQEISAALQSALEAAAFTCGIEILPPFQIDLDCPTLAAKNIAQRRAAEQSDELRRSAEAFSQFQSIRAAAPDLPPGELLQRVGVADQAELLKSLLRAGASKITPQRLWCAAGNSLVEIVGGDSPAPRVIPIPQTLGPLRSIRAGTDGELLLGCRRGILRFQPDSDQPPASFEDSKLESQLGYNAAVIAGDRLWATHGEAGLVYWDLSAPGQTNRVNASASCRNLHRLGEDRLIFSSGRELWTVNHTGEPGPAARITASADILAVFVQADRIIVICEDGAVAVYRAIDLKLEDQQRRAGRIIAAGGLPWLGDLRVMLAGEVGPISCLGVDDEVVTQYASPHIGPRIVAGSGTLVAAVSADRQRLILWNAWDGRHPIAELHLSNLTKHRISDIAFI
jgi:hypothetical protein